MDERSGDQRTGGAANGAPPTPAEGRPAEEQPTEEQPAEGRHTTIEPGIRHAPHDEEGGRLYAEAIVDTVREPLLVLTADLRVRTANARFYDLFGVGRAETEGRLIYELGNGQWDIPELRRLLEEVLPHDRAVEGYEVTHAFERLGERTMLVNARRLDHVLLILLAIEDVTEQRRGERARRASEEHLRLLVENTREYAIFAMDEGSRVEMWSPGAERILGWREGEVLGAQGDLAFTEEDRAAGVPERERAHARATGSALDERWHVRKDGTRFWASGVMVALRDGDDLVGYAKILRDNTERKRAEEEREALLVALAEEQGKLKELNETLEARVRARTREVRRLAARLAAAEREERRRIAEVLHDDLQQRLFGLSALLDLLGDDPSSEEGRELLARVREIAADAMALTRRLAVEVSPPVLEQAGLEGVLRWVAEQQRQRHGLDVEVEVGAPCEVPDRGARELLHRAVSEALFNVVKHAGTRRARVRAWEEGDAVVAEVSDEGAGFDQAALADREAEDGGFGLFSVRERVELAGGRFEVASAPGRGTRVTVAVPAKGGKA